MISIKINQDDILPSDIQLHIVPVKFKPSPFVWLSLGPVDVYLTPATAAKIVEELRQLVPGNIGAEPPVKGADPT